MVLEDVMALELKPLPTKVRTSFDIPALLEILKKGEFATNAKFEDLLVIRNYLQRHGLPYSLSQRKVWEGYVLSLKDKK